MIFRFSAFLFLTFFVTGCSKTIPLKAYENLRKRKTTYNVSTLSANTVGLQLNKNQMADLKTSDSVLIFGSDKKIFSNFKEFSIETEPNAKHRITISSLCDCFGFKKYIFVPLIMVFDKNGTPLDLKEEPESYDYKFGPLSLNKSWVLDNYTEDKLQIVVYSDNRNLNHVLYELIPPVHVKTSLEGTFNITIEAIK